MNVIIFGATGMVGKGALLECLDDGRVENVLVVTRHPIAVSHPKLHDVVHHDFFDFLDIQPQFVNFDACFFCLGVSSIGMSEIEYHRLTYDLTLAAATAIASVTSRRLTFCYVSGEGTDSTERGRVAWARIGKTENALLRLPFKAAFMFRPGYIQPLKGIRSKTRWYQALYNVAARSILSFVCCYRGMSQRP
jgi:nucleoside-diphosphate-sugar epimerase